MACAEIRETLRSNVSESRQLSRTKTLMNKRKSLQDVGLVQFGRNLTEAEVVLIANKLKSKSAVQIDDLALLKIAFIQKASNIAVFLKTKGTLHGLVRELSSSKADFQLVAAECICNLALGDQWGCLQVAKAAAPYLITILSGSNYNLISVSVWALGNLVGSGEKTWKVVQGQGFLGKLLKLITDFDTASNSQAQNNIQQNSLLALVQLLYVGSKMLSVEEIKSIANTLGRLTNTSNKGFRVSEYLLSSLEAAEEELKENLSVSKCVKFMGETELDVETCSSFTASVRTVANLVVEPSAFCCVQVFQRWTLFHQVVHKVLASRYSHLVDELGWLMGNLLNHPQFHTFPERIASDLQVFETKLLSYN